MKKQIILTTLAIMFLASSVLAVNERVQGDINLIWQNYGGNPQHFAGNVTGDLLGTADMTAYVDYDSTYGSIGVTNVDITANLDSEACEGTAVLTNVNFGTDKGTFFLSCGDDLIEGILYGKNGQDENGDWKLMNLKYDGFIIVPIVGPKGDTGEQGIQGEKGETGSQGEQGLQGIKGETGEQGLQGEKGDKGETGEQGIKGDTGLQGIQGVKGDKGDKGDTGTCSCNQTDFNFLFDNMQNYPGFSDFWIWITSPKECISGEKRCSGNNKQMCINYAWITSETCKYGCSNKNCNPEPKENCKTKASEFYCNNKYSVEKDYYSCKDGHGSSTSCDLGYCKYYENKHYCYSGCSSSTGKCK